MKFAVAVVLLAVALGIEAHAVAYSTWGNAAYAPVLGAGTYDGHSWSPSWDHGDQWVARNALNNGQWHEGVWGDRSAWADHGRWAGAWAAPAGIAVAVAPVAVTAHAAVVPVAHATYGHEGSYVAQTRGAVHVAPLSGHANSAHSINVQPAPGTV